MALVTLTTDFGLRDPYIGIMKGIIASIAPATRIIDITHLIEKFAIADAARTIAQSFPYFPEESIHVVVVDPGVGGDRRPLIVRSAKQYFIGPDNGVFSEILADDSKIFLLDRPEYWLPDPSSTFHGRDIFAPVAAHLSNGVKEFQLGTPIFDHCVIETRVAARFIDDVLHGTVSHFDDFGNLITTISNEDLRACFCSRTNKHLNTIANRLVFSVGGLILKGLSTSYCQTDGILCLINSTGMLEIAAYCKSARDLLGDQASAVQVYLDSAPGENKSDERSKR